MNVPEEFLNPELTDESIMPWGKYRGRKLKDVPASYLLWLYDVAGSPKNTWQKGAMMTSPDLYKYIDKVRDCLELEVEGK
jgi:hypothetical protein